MKNKQAVKLTLRKGDQFHPIVPVHRIKRYYADKSPKRAHIEPPPTVLIEDVQSYEVERILNRRWNSRKRRLEYLIKFLGYENDFNLWRPLNDLRETCRDLIENYDLAHPMDD